MKAALVLRPEPGGAATAARLTARGIAVRRCPLFAARSVEWTPPAASQHDALLVTSANAARLAGEGLAGLAHLPTLAVGAATARAAEAAGLTVALTGDTYAAALLARARAAGFRRPLHLAGRDRHDLPGIDAITVYASEPLPVPGAEVKRWIDHVALLHSPRASAEFATLVDHAGVNRADIAIAALSPAVAAAAGEGWAAVATVAAPRDDLLVAAAATLIDPVRAATDKEA